MNQPLYGWLSDIPAYIVSDIENDGTIVGYEGAIDDIVTNSEKEIVSVLLSGCETFYLRVTAKGMKRVKVANGSTVPQLHIHKEHIRNIAFQLVEFV